VVQALASIPGAHVAIAGRGAEEGRLRQIAKDDGSEDRLHLLGVRDDVDALLLAADVFVHPSLSEGLPMAILEAMMASCAIVASRVGGVPEAIQHDETGLLTPASSPEDLSAAVRRLLSSPADRARLGAAARAAATTRFSIGAMVDAYLSIYNRLAREVT
jgi:glycosyltransferase involved in cell wall biosynthesis